MLGLKHEFIIEDFHGKYAIQVYDLPARKWYSLFHKLLQLIDYSTNVHKGELQTIMHLLAKTGAQDSEESDIDLDLIKENQNEYILAFFNIIKDSLLKSSFEEHEEIFDLLFGSTYLRVGEGTVPVTFDTFDSFENKMLIFKYAIEVLKVHFDFFMKIPNVGGLREKIKKSKNP